jgi:putative ABC transport system ATP-binding protein
MIRIENLSKIYTTDSYSLTVLDDVSLHIHAKEFVSITGPSGSGKSTLMNMIGCLDVPTTGNIIIDQKPAANLNENELSEIRNLKIGFIFQGFNLLGKLNAIENVELPLIYRGISADHRKEKAEKFLKLVGLEDRMHHLPSQLSGGQQQRVAIARALAGEPPIILADEPTGNLDSKSGQEVMAMLKELHHMGHTIVLITHDMKIAEKAQRIICIQDGQIVQDTKVGD